MSVLLLMWEVFEYVTASETMSFLEIHQLHRLKQFGFRHGDRLLTFSDMEQDITQLG